jgi:pimeloyl-ACP methyl ester carboxylesterase
LSQLYESGAVAVEDRFVQVQGARVHYQFSGTGSPLLLLHGLVGSGRNWRRNIGFLSRFASVYALDLFNMGESERVPGLDAGLEATADRIVALMDALHLRCADIAAHSHGGAIAMMLAARHPDRVRKLILFAPANPFCDAGRQLIRFYNTSVGALFARIVPSLPRLLHATALARMYGDPTRVAAGSLETYTTGLRIPPAALPAGESGGQADAVHLGRPRPRGAAAVGTAAATHDAELETAGDTRRRAPPLRGASRAVQPGDGRVAVRAADPQALLIVAILRARHW